MQKISEKLRFKCGIYEFFNLENGKRYVGSSVNIYNRIHEHVHNLKNNKAHNKHFQSAWNKYGEDNFIFNILEYCSEEDRFEREQYYIDLISPEYNLTLNVIANTGHSPSKESREKISNTLKAKYKSGEIKTYRQDHAWIKCYIYNIRTFKFEAECDCIADALRLMKTSAVKGERIFNNLFKNRYILSKIKFTNKNDLINYISQNFLVANSKWGKYIIIENVNTGNIKYYRELNTAAFENNSSKSTLGKHGNASKDNPYLIRKSNCLFYYSDEYIPITGYEAVPIEESSELLSGNIGESPEMDNTEINLESNTSKSSYSVDLETQSENIIDPRVSDIQTDNAEDENVRGTGLE